MNHVGLHASCVVLEKAGAAFSAPADAGVLLLGESGSGKSETALELIARGARLVADDRVELFVRDSALWARPPARLAGLIEARGVGIVELAHTPAARIALAVRLVAPEDVPRMPAQTTFPIPAPLAVAVPPPLVLLSRQGATEKIVLAAAAFAHALFRDNGNSP